MTFSALLRIVTQLWPELAVSVVMAFASAGALAATPNTIEGLVERGGGHDDDCQHLSVRASPLVEKICIRKVRVKYQLSLLFGEPVERYRVYWEIDPTLYLRAGVTLGGKGNAARNASTTAFTMMMPDAIGIDRQAPSVQKAFAALTPIDPTKFVISADAWAQGANQTVYFMSDGGALNVSGKGYSFNTPGGPAWNQFMLDETFYEDGKAPKTLPYLGETSAKRVYLILLKSQQRFEFTRIRNLTFGGVSELNAALRGEQVFPLTVNVEGPLWIPVAGGSQIAILNSSSPYTQGMMLKAGRYRIRASHPGFVPVEKWITLDARHQRFSIRLKPAKQKVAGEQKPVEQSKADPAESDSADDMEAMLDATESPSGPSDESNPFSEDTQPSRTEAAPADTMTEALDEVGQQDAAALRQAEAQTHLKNLRPIKERYDATVKRCNADMPTQGSFMCSHGPFWLTVACNERSPRAQRECKEKTAETDRRWHRDCAREREEWDRKQKTFPSRLAAWKRENARCLKQARTNYDAAVQQLKTDERNIDDFASEFQ